MDDDFNAPILIAKIFDGVKIINTVNDGTASINGVDLALLKETIQGFVFDVLGLEAVNANSNSELLENVVNMLIKMRKQARDAKNWALSDQIRDELLALGIQLKDGKDGTSFTY